MKTQKIIRTIITETLHVDSIPALLAESQIIMENETMEGKLIKEDGDTISWTTETEMVEI